MNDDEFRELQRRKATRHGYYTPEKRPTSELCRSIVRSINTRDLLCDEWVGDWQRMTNDVIEAIGLRPTRYHRLVLVPPPASKESVRWELLGEGAVRADCECDLARQASCRRSARPCEWQSWEAMKGLLDEPE